MFTLIIFLNVLVPLHNKAQKNKMNGIIYPRVKKNKTKQPKKVTIVTSIQNTLLIYLQPK
jgi:hypothetical protein